MYFKSQDDYQLMMNNLAQAANFLVRAESKAEDGGAGPDISAIQQIIAESWRILPDDQGILVGGQQTTLREELSDIDLLLCLATVRKSNKEVARDVHQARTALVALLIAIERIPVEARAPSRPDYPMTADLQLAG